MIRLGDLLIKKNLINETQLNQALELQKKRGGLLGVVLVEMGLIDSHVLAEALEEQEKLAEAGFEDKREPAPKMRLGDLLIKEGVITQTELERALERQEETKEKLGFVLMKMGFLDQPTLLRYLSKQAQSIIDNISMANIEIEHLQKKHGHQTD
ncbi:MAG: hypothetical protein OEZ22_05910 [Spirochaetia bacterium]|nr:hypothetical protein [Spirochaetia bacterium]